MDTTFDVVFNFGMGAMVGFVMGTLFGATIMENDYQKKAIEAQCAGYSIQTGEFEWFKPSDKEKNK